MEGDGPTNGTPVPHRVCVVGTDWLAADRVAVELMGINFAKIGYLNYCAGAGLGEANLKKIEILGPAHQRSRQAISTAFEYRRAVDLDEADVVGHRQWPPGRRSPHWLTYLPARPILLYIMEMSSSRVGIWLIGAKGGVASTAIVGLAALRRGLVGSQGLVSQLAAVPTPGLGRLGPIRRGRPRHPPRLAGGRSPAAGHREPHRLGPHCSSSAARSWKRSTAASGRARSRTWGRRLPPWPTRSCRRRKRPGSASPDWPPTWRRLSNRRAGSSGGGQRGLDRAAGGCFRSAVELGGIGAADGPARGARGTVPFLRRRTFPRRATSDSAAKIGTVPCALPASSLYAIAALEAGYSYINFTPSLGPAPAAIDELARLRGTPLLRLRRQDGRDADEERAGPDVRPAEPAGAELGGPQHLRQHGRPGA